MLIPRPAPRCPNPASPQCRSPSLLAPAPAVHLSTEPVAIRRVDGVACDGCAQARSRACATSPWRTRHKRSLAYAARNVTLLLQTGTAVCGILGQIAPGSQRVKSHGEAALRAPKHPVVPWAVCGSRLDHPRSLPPIMVIVRTPADGQLAGSACPLDGKISRRCRGPAWAGYPKHSGDADGLRCAAPNGPGGLCPSSAPYPGAPCSAKESITVTEQGSESAGSPRCNPTEARSVTGKLSSGSRLIPEAVGNNCSPGHSGERGHLTASPPCAELVTCGEIATRSPRA